MKNASETVFSPQFSNDKNPTVLYIPTPQRMFGRRTENRRPSESVHRVLDYATAFDNDCMLSTTVGGRQQMRVNERFPASRPVRVEVVSRLSALVSEAHRLREPD